MLSFHKQRDDLVSKKTSYKIYSKSNSKIKNLTYQSKSSADASSKAYLNEDMSKLASEGLSSAQSPDIMKRNTNLTHNMNNSKSYNFYQTLYTSIDHGLNGNREVQEELSKSAIPNTNNNHSVVTPSRLT